MALFLGSILLSACRTETPISPSLDQFGGYQGIQREAPGFFRLERIEGRWWLITPEGHAFLSSGVNHVDYKGDYSDAFVDFVVGHLRDWGFNTIGWSQESMSPGFVKGSVVHSPGWGPRQYQRAGMPYTHLIPFARIAWYEEEVFPDVFSEEFEQHCERLAAQVCPQLRDDPFLIGYFYADAPNWPAWMEQVGPERIGAVARRYYQVIAEAIRRHDPHHLLLGDRYKADRAIPGPNGQRRGVLPEVLEAMRESVDVLSLEYYRPDSEFDQNLQTWSRLTGKPVLLADSAFLAPTDVLSVPPESPSYVPDQQARGSAYRDFAERIYSNPLIIGWHWCAFGRSPGRRSGLLDGQDRPYQEAVGPMRDFNRGRLYAAALGQPAMAGQDGLSPVDGSHKPFDRWGGIRRVQGPPQGFFRTARIGGRWWLLTPEGNGFISIGMNHLDLAALKHPDNVHIFRDRYGSSDDRFIQEGIARPLRDWGFNTIGWSQESVGGRWMDPSTLLRHSPEWTHRQFQLAGLPYLYNLHFADIENFNFNPHYPDVFDEDFEQWADYVARSACVSMAEDPLLIGYADLPVPGFTQDRPGSWAEGLDLSDPADLAVLKRHVRRYFEVTTQAVRRYDPNHLLFGPRLDHPREVPDWLVEMAGEFFDVLLANRFLSSQEVEADLARWHRLSGRPIIISDFAFLAPTDLLQVTPRAASYVPDQKSRGEAYVRFASSVFRLDFVVGLHWCAFLENRARKSGLKNYRDEPYWDCIRPMQSFNLQRLYPTVLGR